MTGQFFLGTFNTPRLIIRFRLLNRALHSLPRDNEEHLLIVNTSRSKKTLGLVIIVLQCMNFGEDEASVVFLDKFLSEMKW